MRGTVEQIFIADSGSEPMESVERVEAVEQGGLRGDRYFEGTGYYSGMDECQVTLIEVEAIEEIKDEFDIDLTDGRHRRNVVVRGVSVHDLLGERFRVGDAVLKGTRPRPPCAHVERVAGEKGVARALENRRGGICADVVEGGAIQLGHDLSTVEATAGTDD